MNVSEIQDKLTHNGFPCAVDGSYGPGTEGAVRRFQQAYNGDAGWLEPDGKAGPHTQRALSTLPQLSAHFSVFELACRHCGRCYVLRELLQGIEALRERTGKLALVSAYRCEVHNRNVGGAKDSQHVYGRAADLATRVSVDTAISVHKFRGIGTRGNLASHVDVRVTNGSVTAPTRWKY